jgi:hypothetical protein
LAIICTCFAPMSGVEEAERCDSAVEADHLDAAIHRLLADGHERVGVVRGDDEAVDLLRDLRVDHGDLLFRGRLGRGGVDDLHAADFLRRLVRAVGAGVEIAVAEILHDHGHALVRGAGRGCDERRRRGDERGSSGELDQVAACGLHGVFPPLPMVQ